MGDTTDKKAHRVGSVRLCMPMRWTGFGRLAQGAIQAQGTIQ
jgi:hypothetical protein